MDLYQDKKFDKYMRVFLIGSTFLHGANGIMNRNLVKLLFGTHPGRFVLILIAACGAMLAFDRDYYLPFLGDAVFPTGLLAPNVVPNDADVYVTTRVTPGAQVVYWASETCKGTCDSTAFEAYADYSNSGVAVADKEGNVTMMVRGPRRYTIPFKDKVLQPHVHYRTVLANGMMSKVHTVPV